jgi:polysaccharide biosynthesis transport protein
MDTPARPDRSLPSPPSAALPALPMRASWDEGAEAAAAAPPKTLTLRVILRAARRHWWQILGLWLVGTVVAVPLLYKYIKPTFDSSAFIKIEAANRSLLVQAYDQSASSTGNYLDTQVQLILNPDVLGAALQDPKIATLPRYSRSIDAESELRKELRVEIIPKTSLIRLAATTESPTESANVANAVLAAYLKKSEGWTFEETQTESKRLKDLKQEYTKKVDELRTELTRMARKNGNLNPDLEAEKNSITLDTYRSLNFQLDSIQTDRMKAEASLALLKLSRHENGSALVGDRLQEAAHTKFQKEPEALALADRVRAARKQLENAKRFAKPERWSREPTIIRADKDLKALEEQWQQLWTDREPEIKQQLAATGENTVDAQVKAMELAVKLKEEDERLLREQIKKYRVLSKAENENTQQRLEMQYTEIDLQQATQMLQIVDRNLNQLEYEARRTTNTTVIYKAAPNARPTSDNRFKLMASVPVILLMSLMGLFVLVEVRSGRVADPDDLPARVKVGVIGVVPPLPTLRPMRGLRGAKDERRRVEEFVQSLDHLRVTLCAGANGLGGRRCVMITSATGGEGKTTLAAQLAGRCANAGLLTLLVDADLRRPSLGELLEVPEGPGLADVLAGEAEPEEAMVVIGSAGGFHLLPAGSPAADPSRLLQGERLGTLIARFRETFDVVIVDAPPVLAVPDALILGRWVDGAVLAVRHDTSRFPLVERANRRLASIGIAVLGAVVNGVRPMEATYGSYSYSHAGAEDESPA